MIRVKVLLFAEARDRAECDSIDIEVNSQTDTTQIFDAIKQACKDLETLLPTCNLAHNQVSHNGDIFFSTEYRFSLKIYFSEKNCLSINIRCLERV